MRRVPRVILSCLFCGAEIRKTQVQIRHGEGKYCSKMCHGKASFTLNKNPRWNGGRAKHAYGYTLVRAPDHPFAENRGYVREHRLVLEKYLGRYLLPTED